MAMIDGASAVAGLGADAAEAFEVSAACEAGLISGGGAGRSPCGVSEAAKREEANEGKSTAMMHLLSSSTTPD
jgi:hypothetical protein